DADRRLTRLIPASATSGALLARDVRGFVDPLAALREHSESAPSIGTRAPFRAPLIPIDVGRGSRMMRISGHPRFDATGAYQGCRGIAVETEGPPDTAEAVSPQLRQSLANALGLIVGFAKFLQQALPVERCHRDY